MELTEGKLRCPKGFKAAGIGCGLKPDGARDLALIVSDVQASAAGMFTTNRVHAAPIQVNREHLESGRAQAIVTNSKNANACTGHLGLEASRRTADLAGDLLGIPGHDVLVNSTGVIGVPLPMEQIEAGLPEAADALAPSGWDDAAQAIMTTDTVPKRASAVLPDMGVTLCGIAKGAGMIAPNMATMLAFLATDAQLDPTQLSECLKRSVARSFNCVTVDGDMSTNDTVLLLANGAAGPAPLSGTSLQTFQDALDAVCISLARQIARDGEGATKLITVRVSGAVDVKAARTVALSVANSNLVKTAVFGRDPNWGRILCATGYAGVVLDPDRVTVSMAGLPIYERGAGLAFDHKAAVRALAADDIVIDIDLGAGDAEATVYTCDLTYDYVKINAEYTT